MEYWLKSITIMGVFSRRNLYKILIENARFVRNKPLADHIRRLNGGDQVQRVTAEWEVAVLNGLSKIGNADHEPRNLPGTTKPDVLFTHALGTALIDITTVSDRGLDKQNPIDKLSIRLTELIRERGLDPQHFGLQVKGNWRDLRIGGPKPRLFIPGEKEFGTAIFNKHFYRFLDDIQISQSLKRDFSVARPDAQVTITYDPAQKYFWMNHLAYTVPFAVMQNAIYRALGEKASQLKLSKFDGVKGIVLCDGGCDALYRRGRRGLDLDAGDIIGKFLSDHRSIEFVLTLLIESDGSGHSGPDHLTVIAKEYLLKADSPAGPLVNYLTKSLPQGLSKPENIPLNAYDLKNEGNSFNGGGIMSGHSIKMSSRAVMGLLSGKTSQEDFIRDNPHVKEWFARALQGGRLLKDVRIERCEQRDDDWAEFTLSEPDPAISHFPKLRGK